jgi:hypothetical protein
MDQFDTLSRVAAQQSGLRLVWIVGYRDNTTFNQFDGGQERSTEEIDRSKLQSFSLVDRDNGRVVISQEISPGQCFFYRRRTVLRSGQGVADIIHVLGWRLAVDKNVRHVCFLYERDFRLELGDFCAPPRLGGAGHNAGKHPVEFLPCDDVPAF